ncbi:MAG: hypothetical protein RL609_2006, partial [Bacteroidota bacterium]
MAEIVRMPKLSDTMTEGVVAAWHKKIGDKVKTGDLLAEIETDKATMEFESFQDGVLLHIGVEKGKKAPVDSILAILGKEGEDVAAIIAAEATATPKAEEPKAAPVPAAAPAPKAAPAPAPVAAPVAKAAPAPVAANNGRTKVSPLAKKLADEKGLPLNYIPGSGDGGRIVKRDIDAFMAGAAQGSANAVESFYEVEVSQMRKVIARRLAESKFSAPHFYLTMDIDMDNAISARKSINDQGMKVSFNDMVVKACAMAL